MRVVGEGEFVQQVFLEEDGEGRVGDDGLFDELGLERRRVL